MTFMLLTLPHRAQGDQALPQQAGELKPPERAITSVSLVNLIATPERYDGSLVRIIGFVAIEREGNAAYLSTEDYLQHSYRNAIWLDLEGASIPDEARVRCSRAFCLLEGTFKMSERGHLGLFSGSLQRLTRMQENR